MTVIYSLTCMMCGRTAGELRDAVFYPAPQSRRPESGRTRCGHCTGNLYLEPDDGLGRSDRLRLDVESLPTSTRGRPRKRAS